MELKDLETLKTGDIIYSFRDNNFYVYELEKIQNCPGMKEMTVRILLINNIPGNREYNLVHIPWDEEHNTPNYCYEFTDMSTDLNEAYHNFSEKINREIRKLNGLRANMKGLKRKYMLDKKMIPDNEKTWKELGYKSKEDYQEHMNDLYEDLRHGYIG
jgi:hypothetical protein